MPRKSTMTAESKAIVDYLRKFGPTNRTELNSAMAGQTANEITKRLNNLSIAGWVRYVPAFSTWEISPSAHGMFPGTRASHKKDALPKKDSLPKKVEQCAEPVERVPPRTFNFHGTNYVPPAFTPARQGALDFGAVPSRGLRC